MTSVDRGQPRILQQDFKRALREAYQVRREQGLTVSRALHDAVDEVWTALIKPLAVIDPEDREQVERLAGAMTAVLINTPGGGCMRHDTVQAALREFAAPTPQIEEPTGLGAVVEDKDGRSWVRGSIRSDDQSPWTSSADVDCADWADWSEINAVRVLSEGVQP